MIDIDRAVLERRILVLTPTVKDSAMTETVLRRVGIEVACFRNLREMVVEADRGVGAMLLPEEAVACEEHEPLTRWLVRQPPWSDLPVLVLAHSGADSATVGQAMDVLGNVTVLERPIRVSALVSAIRTALRSRQRQYQTREHLARIQKSERELRDFFENAAVGLHVVDPQGIVLRVNRAELAMLGYSRDEYVGRHIADFHVDRQVIVDALERLRSGQRLHDYEARMRCKDGMIKDVLIDSSGLWENGRFVYTRCFTRDVTDRKRAEQALKEADRRKDEFLAILAHELRNPLAPIRNSLHILRLVTHGDPTAEKVGVLMERQVDHMVRLVDDLLEVSRITRGKIELRTERVEVASILGSAIETSRAFIEAAHHELKVDVPSEPLVIEGDPVRLTQVFANLLNNAAKYTDEGGHIRLQARRELGEVVIAVCDDGTGISREMLPRVFDLFAQGNRSASRAQGGLGIGLTLVKMLVDLHGGSVEARSRGPGYGSEFVIRLPLVSEAVQDTNGAQAQSSGTLRPRRILVVDDNQDAASSLGMLLQLLGADVRVVHDGPDALDAVGSFKPEVVLLDIGMPGMDGHEVARRLRQRPEGRDLVLIALTGWGQEQDRRSSQLAGFDHHLIKPADVHVLESLLETLESRPRTNGSSERLAKKA